MEFDALVRSAPTVRFYRHDPVPDETIRRILEQARFAPNGGNRQAWRVVVVSDPHGRKRLRDLYLEPWRSYRDALIDGGSPPKPLPIADEFADRLHEVPLLLVVCAHIGSLALTDSELSRPSIVGGASIYPFVQNVLLGCRNEGLGAALTTILCRVEPEAKAELAIPDEYGIACMLAVGYPEEARLPRKLTRAPVNEFTFRNQFGEPFDVR